MVESSRGFSAAARYIDRTVLSASIPFPLFWPFSGPWSLHFSARSIDGGCRRECAWSTDAIVPKAKVAARNPRDWIQSADIDRWGRELCDLLFANWRLQAHHRVQGFKLAEVANSDLWITQRARIVRSGLRTFILAAAGLRRGCTPGLSGGQHQLAHGVQKRKPDQR